MYWVVLQLKSLKVIVLALGHGLQAVPPQRNQYSKKSSLNLTALLEGQPLPCSDLRLLGEAQSSSDNWHRCGPRLLLGYGCDFRDLDIL